MLPRKPFSVRGERAICYDHTYIEWLTRQHSCKFSHGCRTLLHVWISMVFDLCSTQEGKGISKTGPNNISIPPSFRFVAPTSCGSNPIAKSLSHRNSSNSLGLMRWIREGSFESCSDKTRPIPTSSIRSGLNNNGSCNAPGTAARLMTRTAGTRRRRVIPSI